MRRATLVFFDEAAFSSDELISVCEAFATQNTEFVTSTDDTFNPEVSKRKCPTQLVYASSQDDMSKMFYKHYRNFSKRMLAGDRDYFVADMICECAITTYMKGKKFTPLLTKDKVEAAMKANKDKALREYYNQPTRDGGINQIVKWGSIRRNENFFLPQLHFQPNCRIALAFDPARTNDNSILSAMRIENDKDYGYIGNIVNCINFVDSASKKGYKLDSNRQLAKIRENLLLYNGFANDYDNIDVFLLDQGSGGGGTSTYADNLLNNWTDKNGREHRGLIDKNHDIYKGYENIYPNAVDKLRLLSPKKYRNQMVEEFIELMDLGVIKFPYEYKSEFISIANKVDDETQKLDTYQLSVDEIMALQSIDIMKAEITSIYKYENADKTSITYALTKEKESDPNFHDDRFYTIIMLAHYLYELRRGQTVQSKPVEKYDYSSAPRCLSAINF